MAFCKNKTKTMQYFINIFCSGRQIKAQGQQWNKKGGIEWPNLHEMFMIILLHFYSSITMTGSVLHKFSHCLFKITIENDPIVITGITNIIEIALLCSSLLNNF